MELATDLYTRILRFNEYYASDGNNLCRTPNVTQSAIYNTWVRDHNWLTEKSSYSLLYNAPGCVRLITFDTIAAMIDYLKLSCPGSAKWFRDWYPNGLQVYENHSNSESELMMDSIANTSDKEPNVKHDKFLLVANFIFEMNRRVKRLN